MFSDPIQKKKKKKNEKKKERKFRKVLLLHLKTNKTSPEKVVIVTLTGSNTAIARRATLSK